MTQIASQTGQLVELSPVFKFWDEVLAVPLLGTATTLLPRWS
jgi:hypothetical protein